MKDLRKINERIVFVEVGENFVTIISKSNAGHYRNGEEQIRIDSKEKIEAFKKEFSIIVEVIGIPDDSLMNSIYQFPHRMQQIINGELKENDCIRLSKNLYKYCISKEI